MPIDPMTGLPYDEPMPIDPYDGVWPPDPSWDEPMDPYAQAPEAQQAAAAADALFAEEPQVKLGMPRPVPDSVAPIDDSLITMGDEEPAPPPLTDDERATRLDEISRTAGEGMGKATQDVETPDLIDPFGESYEQRVDAMSDSDLALKQIESDADAEALARDQRFKRDAAKRQADDDAERVYAQARQRTMDRQALIDQEAERLANEKVDPDGWRDSRSTFQTIAMYIAGIVGGLVQSRTGGPNQGLAMINQEIERHIAGQQANLTHRRQLLGDRRGALADQRAIDEADFATQQAFRQAAYQRAFDGIEAEKQQYDQAGTRVRKMEMLQRDLASQAAQARAEALRADEKRQIEIGEYDLKVADHNLKVAAHNAKLAKAGAGGGSASKLKKTASEWNAGIPGAAVFDDGSPLTFAEYRARGEGAKSLTAPTEAEKEARNLAVTGPRGPLMQADGKTFYNPPTDAAPKARQLMYTTGQIVADLDRALYLRDSVGGELGQLNSDERQEYDQIEQRVTLMAKGQHEGMSSDSDLKRLGTSLGVENLASFRSKAHGLKTAREAVVRQANAFLHANSYDGKPVEWPNSQTKATKKTAKEKAAQELIKTDAGNDPSHVPTVVAATGPAGYAAKALDWGYGKLAGETESSPDENRKMRAFIKLATQKGDAASIQALQGIADGSGSEEFRNQAKAALMVIDFLQRTPDEKEGAKEREAEEAFLKEGD